MASCERLITDTGYIKRNIVGSPFDDFSKYRVFLRKNKGAFIAQCLSWAIVGNERRGRAGFFMSQKESFMDKGFPGGARGFDFAFLGGKGR